MIKPQSVQESVLLKAFTYMGVGGEAEYFVQPQNELELVEALSWAYKNSVPITLLGGGSNVLVSDRGIKGLTVRMCDLKGAEEKVCEGDLKISCWAGTQKFKVSQIFLKHKLSPALFLSGLPGDMGGGVFMNAGVREARHPREFCEIVESFDVLKWVESAQEVRRFHFKKEDILWSYRQTEGWQPGVILKVNVSWPLRPIENIHNEVREAQRLRLSKQPLQFPSCGSVFKNPKEGSSGQLIESCGLKGYRIGGAEISDKHANFIVNKEKLATAKDVSDLIQHIQEVVYRERGIKLKPEVIKIGDWSSL